MRHTRGLSDAEGKSCEQNWKRFFTPRYCYKIDTIKRYLKNQSPSKQPSDSGDLKSVTARDFRKKKEDCTRKARKTS